MRIHAGSGRPSAPCTVTRTMRPEPMGAASVIDQVVLTAPINLDLHVAAQPKDAQARQRTAVRAVVAVGKPQHTLRRGRHSRHAHRCEDAVGIAAGQHHADGFAVPSIDPHGVSIVERDHRNIVAVPTFGEQLRGAAHVRGDSHASLMAALE